MTLVPVDLPTPAALRGRWAAHAATCVACGHHETSWAEGTVWHYDDSGGISSGSVIAHHYRRHRQQLLRF